MDRDFDEGIIPDFIQTTLAVSLGAAYKGCEMLGSPSETLSKFIGEMKTLLSVPEGDGLPRKIGAMAGLWLEKGANMVTDCKTAGEKFTKGE